MVQTRSANSRRRSLRSTKTKKVGPATDRIQTSKSRKQPARNSLANKRLRELEDWYQQFPGYYHFHNATLNDEIIDEEEIGQAINELVPSIRKDLRGEYCHRCREFPEKWSRILHGKSLAIVYFTSIREMAAGNIAGCRLCRLLVQHLRSYRGNPTDALLPFHKTENRFKLLAVPTNLMLFRKYNMGLGYSNCRTGELGSNFIPHSLEVSEFDSSAHFSPTYRLSHLPNACPLDKARRWLAACTEEHPLCNSTKFTTLPTRLLDLGSLKVPGGEHPHRNQTVRLVETTSLNISILYATLSHCWGKLDFLKLTTENLDSFKTSIPYNFLTKTFQDAINVCRELGLQYLWIDSLCIIQNSPQDWKIEAGRMASVYGGSHVNIAAAHAEDGSEGLFIKDANTVDAAYIPSSSPNLPAYTVTDSRYYLNGISSTHLSSRAWAFQERILSSRVLHFGSGDLFWECRTKNASEYFPNGLFPYDKRPSSRRPKPSLDNWPQIIELYSKCKMTYYSDKLVALAGVACISQRDIGDEYVAGLWRTRMEELLLWHRLHHNRNPVLPRSGPYRAPTWSWASIDGPVRYPVMSRTQLLSNVLNVTVLPAGPDQFGQLRGGVLTLGCPGMLSPKILGKAASESIAYHAYLHSVRDIDLRERDMSNVKFVPILSSRKFRYPTEILGLILQSTGVKKDEFERISMFVAEGGTQADFSKALQRYGPGIARECCAETRIDPKSGKEQFVITIV